MWHHEWPGVWTKERMEEAIKAREQDRLGKQARPAARDSRKSVVARGLALVTALFRG